jgi:hypothetical protein
VLPDDAVDLECDLVAKWSLDVGTACLLVPRSEAAPNTSDMVMVAALFA